MGPFPDQDQLKRLILLLEENNHLLREVLVAQGVISKTPSAPKQPTRTYTAKDVTYVTRADRLRMQAEAQSKAVAPWRTTPVSGQASGTMPSESGRRPSEPADNPQAGSASIPDAP